VAVAADLGVAVKFAAQDAQVVAADVGPVTADAGDIGGFFGFIRRWLGDGGLRRRFQLHGGGRRRQ